MKTLGNLCDRFWGVPVIGMMLFLGVTAYRANHVPPPIPEMPQPRQMTDDEIRVWEENIRNMPPPPPRGPPLLVRDLPEMELGPNGRVHRIVGPGGEVETKRIHKLAVEMRVYAADGTFAIVDETAFTNSFGGDLLTAVWQ